jgi:hypothetical protein
VLSNDQLFENGDLKPEIRAQAEDLMHKLATLCRNYDPTIRLFCLEAAMTEEVKAYFPPAAELFEQMLEEFKGRVAMLAEMSMLIESRMPEIQAGLKAGTPVEEIAQALFNEHQDRKTKE